MNGWLRAVKTRVRRSPARWAFLVLVGYAIWVVTGFLDGPVPLWDEVSPILQYATVGLGPVVAGFTALTAAQDRKRPLKELLASAVRRGVQIRTVVWGGEVSWVGVAYLVAATFLVVRAAVGSTWGGPDLGLIAGLVALGSCGALGLAAGWLFPSRLTAPVVAVVLWVALSLPLTFQWPVQLLTGVTNPQVSPFYDFLPAIPVWQIVWFSSILASLILLTSVGRRVVVWAALAVSVAVAYVSGTVLIELAEDPYRSQPAPYSNVCSREIIEVCVHPAYRNLLPTAAPLVSAVAAPLAEAGMIPPKGVQGRDTDATDQSDAFSFSILSSIREDEFALSLARSLVNTCRDDPAANAVAAWLVARGGYEVPGGILHPEEQSATERLLALSEEGATAWLADAADDLRDCSLPVGEVG